MVHSVDRSAQAAQEIHPEFDVGQVQQMRTDHAQALKALKEDPDNIGAARRERYLRKQLERYPEKSVSQPTRAGEALVSARKEFVQARRAVDLVQEEMQRLSSRRQAGSSRAIELHRKEVPKVTRKLNDALQALGLAEARVAQVQERFTTAHKNLKVAQDDLSLAEMALFNPDSPDFNPDELSVEDLQAEVGIAQTAVETAQAAYDKADAVVTAQIDPTEIAFQSAEPSLASLEKQKTQDVPLPSSDSFPEAPQVVAEQLGVAEQELVRAQNSGDFYRVQQAQQRLLRVGQLTSKRLEGVQVRAERRSATEDDRDKGLKSIDAKIAEYRGGPETVSEALARINGEAVTDIKRIDGKIKELNDKLASSFLDEADTDGAVAEKLMAELEEYRAQRELVVKLQESLAKKQAAFTTYAANGNAFPNDDDAPPAERIAAVSPEPDMTFSSEEVREFIPTDEVRDTDESFVSTVSTDNLAGTATRGLDPEQAQADERARVAGAVAAEEATEEERAAASVVGGTPGS